MISRTNCILTDRNQDSYQKKLSINVTKTLDQLLKGYDKRIRPNYAGN